MSSASGFYNAPITKVLCVGTTLSTLLLSAGAQGGMGLGPKLIFVEGKPLRILTHNVFYEGLGDMVAGTILMYMMRTYERRVGSPKFAAYLTATVMASSMWQLATVSLVPAAGRLAAGPLGLIASLLVQYYRRVPCLMPRAVTAFGVQWTDKSVAYVLGVQLALSHGLRSLIPFSGGLLAGWAWSANLLPSRLLVPSRRTRGLFTRYVLPWLGSGPTPAVRAQQRAATQDRRRGLGLDEPSGDGWGEPAQGSHQAELEQLRQAMMASMAAQGQGQGPGPSAPQAQAQAQAPQPPQQPQAPREEDVDALTAMGFLRADAVQALHASQGNLEAAANSLLSR